MPPEPVEGEASKSVVAKVWWGVGRGVNTWGGVVCGGGERWDGIEETPGVADGVARGKSTDDGHDEGDEDSVVVVGLARISGCFITVL